VSDSGCNKKLRNLTSDEILAQMFFAKKIARLEDLPDITNVVFSLNTEGGEPVDNVDNVRIAVNILTNRDLFHLSASRIVISTAGSCFTTFNQLTTIPAVVAWSIPIVKDNLDQHLVTSKYTMKDLRQEFIDTLQQRPMNFRMTMLDVVLIAGVNDSIEHANDLAEFTKVIMDQVQGVKVTINLIPFHDSGTTNHYYYKSNTNDESVLAFQQRLEAHGLSASIRPFTSGYDKKIAVAASTAT